MMTDLLKTYECLLDDSDENEGWMRVLEKLTGKDIFVGYLPSITFDMWPAYVLECTQAKRFIDSRYKEHV